LRVIKLQPKQIEWLSSPADIAIGGGSAGGGKSYGLTVEPARYWGMDGFHALMLRRTYPEITKPGGLWDEGLGIYPAMGAKANKSDHSFSYKRKNQIWGWHLDYGHLTNEATLENWKSAQISLLMFDQLETFTERMFFYMMSRNRSPKVKIAVYCRASANPLPNWLAEFLDWWIADDGYANLDRVGKLRYFFRLGDEIVWGNSDDELMNKYPNDVENKTDIKSVTFVPFTIYDNKILMKQDPSYLSNLKALSYIDRQRLLGDPERGGNWKIRPTAGGFFRREWFEIIRGIWNGPGVKKVRYWDLAGTQISDKNKDPDKTAGIRMAERNGEFLIEDARSIRGREKEVQDLIYNTAMADGHDVEICIEQEGGAGSKNYIANLARTRLMGYTVYGQSVRHDKQIRAKPLSAAAENGLVKMTGADWNFEVLEELYNFPDGAHDDFVDACSGAYIRLSRKPVQEVTQHRW